MFQTITPQAIIDDVNALTDNDGYSLVSNAQLVAWMNNELTTLWQWARRCNRDVFTKVTGTLTMPAGASSMSMTAAAPAGAALTDWSSGRGVDIQVGGGTADSWKKLKPWNFATRDRIYRSCYRFIGDTLYLLPTVSASQYPLRVWYIYSAPVVLIPGGTLTNTALSIPDGADEYIKQGLAAKVRTRLDDDPTPHLQAQGSAKLALEAFLATAKGDQGIIADVADETYPEMY